MSEKKYKIQMPLRALTGMACEQRSRSGTFSEISSRMVKVGTYLALRFIVVQILERFSESSVELQVVKPQRFNVQL